MSKSSERNETVTIHEMQLKCIWLFHNPAIDFKKYFTPGHWPFESFHASSFESSCLTSKPSLLRIYITRRVFSDFRNTNGNVEHHHVSCNVTSSVKIKPRAFRAYQELISSLRNLLEGQNPTQRDSSITAISAHMANCSHSCDSHQTNIIIHHKRYCGKIRLNEYLL